MSRNSLRVDNKPLGATPATWRVGFKVPFVIIGSIVGAIVAATFHHFFDVYLEGKEVSGFWNQTTTRRFENAIATVVKFLLSLSAATSLCQVAWYKVRQVSFRISDLDALLSDPSVLSIFHPTLIFQAPIAISIVIAITASPVIPVLAPSLTVRLGNAAIQPITVPTLDLVSDRDMGAVEISSGGQYIHVSDPWDKVAVQGLVSSTAIHWPIPDQCVSGCQYNVTYSATALRCSDLDPQSISDSVPSNSTIQDPPAAYLPCYDGACSFDDAPDVALYGGGYSILNFTVQERPQYNISANISVAERDHYGITLAYLPFDMNHSNFGTSPYGSARGCVCTFHNATYMARVLFVNGTQANDIQVLEYHNPVNTSTKLSNDLILDYSKNVTNYPTGEGQNLNLLAMADSFVAHLQGSIIIYVAPGIPIHYGTGELITKVNLFDFITTNQGNSLFLNTAGGVTNLSQGLTDLMANMTLNFMNINGIGKTSVLASIPSTANVYQYNRRPLLLTYVIAISVMSAAAVMGLKSLASNGVESFNAFSQMMVTTRNSTLDSVAREACLGSAAVQNRSIFDVRLRFGKSSLGTHGEQDGFEVVADEEVGLLKKDGFSYWEN